MVLWNRNKKRKKEEVTEICSGEDLGNLFKNLSGNLSFTETEKFLNDFKRTHRVKNIKLDRKEKINKIYGK